MEYKTKCIDYYKQIGEDNFVGILNKYKSYNYDFNKPQSSNTTRHKVYWNPKNF
jgi:hypothetical protein